MKESFDEYASKVQPNSCEEKEHCQAFDMEEKHRIFCKLFIVVEFLFI